MAHGAPRLSETANCSDASLASLKVVFPPSKTSSVSGWTLGSVPREQRGLIWHPRRAVQGLPGARRCHGICLSCSEAGLGRRGPAKASHHARLVATLPRECQPLSSSRAVGPGEEAAGSRDRIQQDSSLLGAGSLLLNCPCL